MEIINKVNLKYYINIFLLKRMILGIHCNGRTIASTAYYATR